MSDSLFAQVAKNFTIVRVTGDDAHRETDQWQHLRDLILNSESMYPKIGKWLGSKVRTGLRSKARSAFVGYHNGVPAVSCVLKHGPRAKLCHLKVHDRLQKSNIGEFFFALTAMEVASRAKQIHFTLPSSLWDEKKYFFSSFSFRKVEKAEKQYRLFDEELHCSAPFDQVWHSVVNKLPKLMGALSIENCSLDSRLLMSLRPSYAKAILNGTKSVEIRRSFSRRWLGSRVSLYATSPTKSLVGEAVIEKLSQSDPESIWGRFGGQIGCTKAEYDAYVTGADQIFALTLCDVRAYTTPLGLREARHLIGDSLRVPQSYSKITPDSPWGKALPIASLLQAFHASSISYPIV